MRKNLKKGGATNYLEFLGVRVDVSCKPRVTEIKADQPFYYQIVEDDTGAVLFAGVVRVPSAPGDVEASGASKENLNGMSGEDDY